MKTEARPQRHRSLLGNLAVGTLLLGIAAGFFGLQRGGWWLAAPPPSRWVAAGLLLLGYAAFVATVLWRSRPARGNRGDSGTLVVWASQTGFARQLAESTAQNLRDAGQPVRLLPIDQLDAATLARAERALFIASTTGEGDPPDHALGFVRKTMAQPAPLPSLAHAVLALGDREYERFCAFGHRLDDWLRRQGSQPLFERIDVDNADAAALGQWQQQLQRLGGSAGLPGWAPPRYEDWALAERQLLNPGSLGEPVFHVELAPPAGTQPQWQAGDIADIRPYHAPQAIRTWLRESGLDGDTPVSTDNGSERLFDLLQRSRLPARDAPLVGDAQALADALQALPHREYSIASLPADGRLHLLVRRMPCADGSPGLGSGWLGEHAAIGSGIALRLRGNPNFHVPADDRPLILIGNGTGIAGLRALLKQRVANGQRRNWLLFGERQRAHDFFHGDELLRWQAGGFIERLDLAFSRDQARRVYVQDLLRGHTDDLRRWLADGASIYVCGSLAGMAPAVDAVLREALGDDAVETLQADGRYRRDVY